MRRFIAPLLLLAILSASVSTVWAVPTVTALNILSAHAFQCVAEPLTCVPGSGNVLYVVHYRIVGTPGASDFAGQYFLCRLTDTVTGAVLGQVDAANSLGTGDPDGKGFPEGICSFYLSAEPANPVAVTLAGKPSGFVIPPSVSETAWVYYPNGRLSLGIQLVTLGSQSLAGILQSNLVLVDNPLIQAQPDGTIRLTDLGALYFATQIPGLVVLQPNLFQNNTQDNAIINETADFSFQTGLRAVWSGTIIGQSFEAMNTLLHFPSGSTWGSSVLFLGILALVVIVSIRGGLSMPMTLLFAFFTVVAGALSGFILMVWVAIPALGAAALLTSHLFELKRSG